MASKKLESALMKASINLLETRGAYSIRVNSGTILVRDDKGAVQSVVKLARKGTPDIICCYKGFFFAIEVKESSKEVEKWWRQVKKHKDSLQIPKSAERAVNQYHEIQAILRAGGKATIIGSLKELEDDLKRLDREHKKRVE